MFEITTILEEVKAMPVAEVHEEYHNHINPALLDRMRSIGFERTFDHGEGSFLYDTTGKAYLDCLGGYGAMSIGHNHPVVTQALRWALDNQVVNYAQASISRWATALAKELSQLTQDDLPHVFFSNSGAEAVEAALKTARKSTGRKTIICFENSFHGKTYGALSVTGQKKYQEPFAPLVPDIVCVPYNDIEAFRHAMETHEVAAVIIEPIQGEGGVIIPDDSYMHELGLLIMEFGALLIMDEIQTGFGRTGTMFRYQYLGMAPDILVLAKALGGGLTAIGATLFTDEVWHSAYNEQQDCALHTSTFGGGGLASIVGLATVKVIQKDGLPERARVTGEWLKKELLTIQETYPDLIKEVRGAGLMIGMEFEKRKQGLIGKTFAKVAEKLEGIPESEAIAALVAREQLNRGVVTAFTLNKENVIRIAPPLNATKEELEFLLKALRGVLQQHKSLFSLNGGLGGAVKSVIKK